MSKKTFEEVLNETGSLFYKSVGISMLPLIHEGRDSIYSLAQAAAKLNMSVSEFTQEAHAMAVL